MILPPELLVNKADDNGFLFELKPSHIKHHQSHTHVHPIDDNKQIDRERVFV